MVNVTLTVNLDDIIDDLDDLIKRQVPYAAYLALNESVYKSSIDVKKAMPYFIEGGPVPFTARGVQYTKAKSKRELVASVFIPDAQWKYMRWIVDGGVKRWGKSKHGIGKPIYENVRFNKYGNLPGRKRKEGVWREILNRSKKGTVAVPMKGGLGKGEFIADINGNVGLWKRLGKDGRSNIKLLVKFTHEGADYGKGRFPFQKFAIKYVAKSFPKNFNRRLVEIVNNEAKKIRAK